MADQKLSAKNLYLEVLNYSKHKLKQKEDLERLIEISIQSDNFSILEKSAFTAKYLQGLFSIVQRGDKLIDEEVFKKYTSEYSENLEKLKNNLKIIIKGTGEFYNKIFEEKYFSLTQSSINNLNNLCYDLSWLKMYLNDKRTELRL
jgi:hypothetical protein